MRIAVLGGSGGVGRHLLARAVARGHDVVALLRPTAPAPATAGLAVVRGDPLDEAVLREVFAGREAVASALGMRRASLNPMSPILGPPDFDSASARAIVAAMRACGVPKVVAVSAAGVADSEPRMNLVMRLLVRYTNLGVPYRDLAEMERVYAGSGLDWCCVRPTALTDRPGTGRVALVDAFGLTATIPRADVAAYVLDRVEGTASGPRLPQISAGAA